MATLIKFHACVLVNFLAAIAAKDCQGEQCSRDNDVQSLLQAHTVKHHQTRQAHVPNVPNDDSDVIHACKDKLSKDMDMVDFSLSTVVHSNLGGRGPNKDAPEEIYYANVAINPATQKPVDLKIVATSDYVTLGTPWNGLKGDFGKIMMRDGTSLGLKFSLVDPDDGTPVTLNKFAFTFLDFDFGSPVGRDQETLTMSPKDYSRYLVSENTEITVVDTDSGSKTFGASTYGTDADNPWDVMDLTLQQANRAVTFIFEGKSEFSVTLAIGFDRGDFYRMFFFQGQSELAYQEYPECCLPHICQTESTDLSPETVPQPQVDGTEDADEKCSPGSTNVRFSVAEAVYNNLGGQGPEKIAGEPEIMRFKNAAKRSNGENVDLVVETLGGYTATDSSQNGVFGDFLNVNVAANSEVELKISFVDSSVTDSLSYVKMEKFEITVWDIDQKKGAQETVSVKGYDNYYVASGHEFDITKGKTSGGAIFTSTHTGKGCDNPLNRDDLDYRCGVNIPLRAVLFEFKDTESFTVKLGVVGKKNGRNFLFSGASPKLCPSSSCQDECASISDIDDKCHTAGCAACGDCQDDGEDTVIITTTADCHPDSTRTRLSLADVVLNNLGGQGPEKSTEEVIRIRHAAMTPRGRSLDLVVSADNPYVPKNSDANGLFGDFIQINLAQEQEVVLDFRFVDSKETADNSGYVTLDHFEFTLYDIDQGDTGGQEMYTVDGYESYHAVEGHEFDINQDEQTFVSSHFGNGCDNPVDRTDMGKVICEDTKKNPFTVDKSLRSVLFEFKNASGFKLKFGVGGNTNGKKATGGRNVLISGATPVLCAI